MIRIIMVALTVVLFLIFSVPLLGILGARDKKDPEGAQIKSLHIVQGVFRRPGCIIEKIFCRIFKSCRRWRITKTCHTCDQCIALISQSFSALSIHI